MLHLERGGQRRFFHDLTGKAGGSADFLDLSTGDAGPVAVQALGDPKSGILWNQNLRLA